MDTMLIYIEKELVENLDRIHLLTDLTAEKMNVGEEFRQMIVNRGYWAPFQNIYQNLMFRIRTSNM